MIYDKNHQGYSWQLARWLSTAEGRTFALFILDQLVSEIETNRRGHITRVEINGDAPVVLPVID